jgi:hypothetical protein
MRTITELKKSNPQPHAKPRQEKTASISISISTATATTSLTNYPSAPQSMCRPMPQPDNMIFEIFNMPWRMRMPTYPNDRNRTINKLKRFISTLCWCCVWWTS